MLYGAPGWNGLGFSRPYLFEGEEKFMPTDVVMPQMGESITEGTITKWLKKPGDTVQRDEPLFEISTDKVDAEIPSPAAGILKDIKITEGTTVQINTVVATIEENGSGSAPAASPAKAETAASPAADTSTPAAVDTPAATQGNPAEADVAAAGTDGVASDAVVGVRAHAGAGAWRAGVAHTRRAADGADVAGAAAGLHPDAGGLPVHCRTGDVAAL